MRIIGICLLIVVYVIILIPNIIEGYADAPAVSTREDTSSNLSADAAADSAELAADLAPTSADSVYASTNLSSGGASTNLSSTATSTNPAGVDGSINPATGENWAASIDIHTQPSTTSSSMPIETAESIAAKSSLTTPEDVSAVGSLDITTAQYYTLKTLFVAFKQNIEKLKSVVTVASINARAANTTIPIDDANLVQYKAATDFVLDLFHDVELYDAKITEILNDSAIPSGEKITRIGMLLDSYDRFLNNRNVSSGYTREIKLMV